MIPRNQQITEQTLPAQIGNRDASLDFVKGYLVCVVMVMGHIVSLLTTAGYDGVVYFRFGTGSFVFISGYIVAVFYSKKYLQDKKKICKRLVNRGLKLLLIFTFLNILINVFALQSYKSFQNEINPHLMNLYSIYITGGSSTSFAILVPIAYLLILSPFLLAFQSFKKTIVITTSLLLLAYVFSEIHFYNLYFLLIGLTGLSIGLMDINDEAYAIKYKTIIILVFCITILTIKFFDKNIITYVIGILINLKLVYDFSRTQNLTSPFYKLIILLGQYSLLTYLMQIFFLQMVYRLFLKQKIAFGYEAFLIFVITNIFLILLCLLLELLRSKLKLIDKSYKMIFS